MRPTTFNSGFREERWLRMMTLSLCFHLAVFSTVLFIPKTTVRYPSIEGRVYDVELVGPPSGVGSGVKERGIAKGKETSRILDGKTRRIALKRKKAVPILAKRVSPKPITREMDRAHSPSELIDKAISKIERKAEEEETNHLEKTLYEIERTVKDEKTLDYEKVLDRPEGDSKDLVKGERGGIFGMSSDIGTVLKLYQMEIEDIVKSNWSYPVALLNLKRGKIPEAVVIVTVRSDGKILKTWFKRRSKNPLFDDSVLKAIERSDPLPGFPHGYRRSYDEVEINFSLKDLV
jgi:colicin import membrane protein